MVSSKAMITLMGFLCIALLLASTGPAEAINLPVICLGPCSNSCNSDCISKGYSKGGACLGQRVSDMSCCCNNN
ncbi:hypothetical protein CsatB_024964 [Cannabis sativa]